MEISTGAPLSTQHFLCNSGLMRAMASTSHHWVCSSFKIVSSARTFKLCHWQQQQWWWCLYGTLVVVVVPFLLACTTTVVGAVRTMVPWHCWLCPLLNDKDNSGKIRNNSALALSAIPACLLDDNNGSSGRDNTAPWHRLGSLTCSCNYSGVGSSADDGS